MLKYLVCSQISISEAKDIIEGLFRRFLLQFSLKILDLRIFGYCQFCKSRIKQPYITFICCFILSTSTGSLQPNGSASLKMGFSFIPDGSYKFRGRLYMLFNCFYPFKPVTLHVYLSSLRQAKQINFCSNRRSLVKAISAAAPKAAVLSA